MCARLSCRVAIGRIAVTWKDKLEIGLKEDAPYRKDNLPPSQVRGPEVPAGEGRSPEIPLSRDDQTIVPATPEPAPVPLEEGDGG
jgi:hypothetical protein